MRSGECDAVGAEGCGDSEVTGCAGDRVRRGSLEQGQSSLGISGTPET